jgi:hypothetical protein
MPMRMEYETVAIPIVKGLDVTTRARLVQAPSLLQAQNSRFPRGSGSAKRRGHLATILHSPVLMVRIPLLIGIYLRPGYSGGVL